MCRRRCVLKAQRRRGLRAARSGLSRGSARLHAPRFRPSGSFDAASGLNADSPSPPRSRSSSTMATTTNASTSCCADESELEGPVYVIYTSGSTGAPKGISRSADGPWTTSSPGQCSDLPAGRCQLGERALQFTPLSFDVHYQEFFSTWATGGTLVLIDEETRLDPSALLATIERERIARVFNAAPRPGKPRCGDRLSAPAVSGLSARGRQHGRHEQLRTITAEPLRRFFSELKGLLAVRNSLRPAGDACRR